MSTLIAYASSHGTTEQAAKKLSEMLEGEVSVVNLKQKPSIDFSSFNTIIVGGSIHAGRMQGKVKKFCLKHADTLKQKRLGLFLCCMAEGEEAQKEFAEAYPEELRTHAAVTGLFGGEFKFESMNFLQKAIVKKVANVTESVYKINRDNIRQFADMLNK